MILADLKIKIVLISKIIALPYLVIKFLSTPYPVAATLAVIILIAFLLTLDNEINAKLLTKRL